MAAEFSEKTRLEIEQLMSRYPDRHSAIMNALHVTQREFGYISRDALEALSELMEVPVQHLEDTAGFYTMYFKEPVGRHVIWVCHTLSCSLRGAADTLSYIKKKLGTEVGETTPDGKFTLLKAECLASCGSGPMMQIDDYYYENLTYEKIDKILGGFD